MLRARITPFLLLRGQGLVKTRQFGDAKYVGDPINAVKIFNEKEVDELVLLDIEASSRQKRPNLELLQDIAAQSRMPLCYGGGVRDAGLAAEIIALGYEKISISAAALERPDLIAELAARIGTQSTVVTLDLKREGLLGGYRMYSHNATRRHRIDPFRFMNEAQARGAGEIVINSIDRDGMMNGYDIGLARKVRAAVNTPVTVVGGCGSIEHMRMLIDEMGPVGVGSGSFFVFKGKFRAVLLSYERPC